MKALAQNTLIQNRYLIVHLIGKGGMGEVYLAVDQRLGSAVALKRTFFAGDETLGSAFEREARILARMRHPVLPKVSDHFGEGEEQYLVMEHISGDDLAKRLEVSKKPFPLSWVMFWADQLLDALSYLHSHEPPIIHRDIKPQNLKLTDENHIVLLDFGLSKSSKGQTRIESGSTGSVVGYTPHYAPMEQIRGIGTSARSDLYSLSATLYQLMTNTVPADALSRADAMLNEMPDPIRPPHELNTEVPIGVSEVILKGMEVSQEKRFVTAREMQKALRKAFSQMQQAMAAETVAFNIGGEQMAQIEQPPAAVSIPGPHDIPYGSQPGSYNPAMESTPTRIAAPSNGGEVSDMEATIAYDPVADSAVRQSDVKTEVFLGGGVPFAIPEEPVTPFNSEPRQDAAPVENFGETKIDNFAGTNDFRSGGFDSQPSQPTPDATTPYIALDQNSPPAAPGNEAAQNFYSTPGFGTPADSYSQRSSSYDEESRSRENVTTPPVERQAVVTQAPKKKSSGKVFAVLGGLAVFLVLATAAAAGGWYYYANYYAAQTDPQPSPSPLASVEPSPSPEPTTEAVFDTNSNQDIGTDSNTNQDDQVNVVEPTPIPTESDEPAARPTPVATRPTPVTTRPTPVRPTGTPGTKPTPKPKPTTDRTRILQ